ncbi:LLM class F420-dependent oxidoreductase [Microlunatus panaciterrae]|uniref:Alkanesulfonate monooxygenase SsuD/methylene tetrahydromethanopterin reductase-like flavin-dependent oxidoreductase (Luciferase family) n=1 Tax=Microlunatus panaciterrae TaxID=400768 RepID=A0ABS2RJ13_9ACTN|nr:alkanesulfonate monooxygenase SsuD/methylene tetrahydromethanopterin reductase-like flavin-dependent oxidoreductase (luciferase family) [Microlunatus panaciterrae]
MKFGINLCTLGEYADPRRVVELALVAEHAGWEGLFVWDHLGFVWGAPAADPWVTLAAVAQATSRLTIGTAVTPLARRRPQVVAQSVSSLDLLSGGRVVFGAGLGGVPAEFSAFGDVDDARVRAERLDESLEVVAALWSGERVDHHGRHLTVDGVTLAPVPVQRPRVPIWIGGESAPARRRARRWDGWIVGGDDTEGRMTVTPEQMATRIHGLRPPTEAYDVALTGVSQEGDTDLARRYADAGVTWWLESIHGLRGSPAQLLERIGAGPPKGA